MATADTFDRFPPVSSPTAASAEVSKLASSGTINGGPVLAAGVAVIAGAVLLANAVNWRQSALFLVGVAAGVVLYHAAFGFTSSWRQLIAERRGAGLRAQMVMLAATCIVFFPLLAHGELFGQTVRGSVAPLSLAVIAGAFIFGLGMQLGGGCASGTLYSAGGGSIRMFVTLAAFIAGSVLGLLQLPFWEQAPAWPAVSLVARLGMWTALAASLALFAAVAALAQWLERRQHGVVEPVFSRRDGRASLLRGPWPLVGGALGLAAVNIATLTLAGRPWGVTSAFALWGSKLLMSLGVDVAAWPYWQSAARATELQASVLRDVTSVMDVGIMLGALAAAGLAGRFAPTWRVPLRSLLAAIVGGLMLGYGARIAYGCNIGAYFSGIASSSLHGWLWFAAAFIGNIAGTRLRPLFGLRG
jgi:uncharacterized membrane protein YedE/YeeE